METLGGKTFSLKYRLNRTEPEKYLEYGASGLLRPLRLASGSFTIEPFGSHTKLVAQVHIGYKLPVIDWLVRAFVNPAAIRQHMIEEGQNLNKALST